MGRKWDGCKSENRPCLPSLGRWDGCTTPRHPPPRPPASVPSSPCSHLSSLPALHSARVGTAWHGSRHGFNLKNLPCLPGLSRCHGSTGVHTPPHALHYPKPPFAFAHALMHCNQRARSKNKCQSSPLTLLKLTRSCPQLSVKRTVLDGFGDVITNYSI
jgi:hypothetical protein